MRRLRALALAASSLLAAFAAAAPAHGATGSLAITGVERHTATPTGAAIDLSVDTVFGVGRLLQSARVTLPAGFTWTPAAGAASGRQQCNVADFAAASAIASRCGESSRIGTASVTVPGEPAPWTGTIALGQPVQAGRLPSLYVEASAGGSTDPGAPRFKVVAGLAPGGDGRLDLALDQIPSPAFSNLRMVLDGGQAALLTTPASCGATAATATLVDAAGGPRFDTAAPVTFDAGCAAPGVPGGAVVVPGTSAAGQRGPVSIIGERTAGAPEFSELRAQLPAGLLGDLSSTTDCGTFPSCDGSSAVGQLRVAAGNGGAPLQLSGPLFLTTRPGGAVAGLGAILAVRSSAGDLGTVYATGRLTLRPTDAGMDVAIALPRSASGVPLALQRAELAFDRPGFILHPSRCGPVAWNAAIVVEGGGVGAGTGAASYSGCEAPAFGPTLAANLTGDTVPRGHPTVEIGLTAREGDANLAAAVVRLPPNLAAELANVDNPCELALFNAADCSANTRVGTAVARVAVTGEPVPGDVFLVRIPGETLPGLGMSFTGRFAQRVIATVAYDKANRLVVSYSDVPDLPLRRLDMTITGGDRGPLRIVAGTCKKGMVWDASFAAHGGQRSSHTIPAPCPLANASRAKITLSSTKGMRVRLLDLGGRRLHSAKVTLPRAFGFVKSRASNRRYRSLRLGVGTGTIRVLPRSVQVFPKTKSADRLDLTLRNGTVRGPKIRRGVKAKSVLVEIRLAFTDGTVQRQRVRVVPK